MPPDTQDKRYLAMRQLLNRQQTAFQMNPMPSAARRKGHLARLASALKAARHRLAEAIDTDFNGRSRDETLMAEIFPSLAGIRYAVDHASRWMRPDRRRVGLIFQPAQARVLYQPLGVVGIISPWNYPVYLTIGPLTGALAAGNRVMIKASEFTPNTTEALREMLAGLFADDHVAVISGDADVAAAFSRLDFDHLLFTGSTAVGHRVMHAAAENLTPVTLELGGKSPALVAPDYPIDRAAGRIAFGKCFNAGQTCIAPDYLLCPQARLDAFVNAFSTAVARMYPTMAANPDYTAILNQRQFKRLSGYLTDAREKGGRLVEINPSAEAFSGTGKMPVWLVLEPTRAMTVMQEEIFGPILPVVTYRQLSEAVDYVNGRPRPLALYYFDENSQRIQTVLNQTRSGGVCINDALAHVAQDDLPFGGIGQSGMGAYHGRAGFLTFSKARPVFERGRLNSTRLAWPPYGRRIHRWLYRFLLH
ncbi:MAG: coniferyl aldehyde dehydrogenase [Desulfosarcina sp.]|nr:coniferyl aldehyde dehydrogenase [Desulfosarcina sp.]